MKLSDIDQVKRWAAQLEAAGAICNEAQFLHTRPKKAERVSDIVVKDAGKFAIEGRDRHGKTLRLNLSFEQASQLADELVTQARSHLSELGVEIEDK